MAKKPAIGGLQRYWPRLLLVIPFLLVAYVPFYNRVGPALAGIPFFYWYQLSAILLGAAVVMVVYLIEMRLTRTTGTPADVDSSGTPGDIL
jgi:Protein of unknown function (DUF3311)